MAHQSEQCATELASVFVAHPCVRCATEISFHNLHVAPNMFRPQKFCGASLWVVRHRIRLHHNDMWPRSCGHTLRIHSRPQIALAPDTCALSSPSPPLTATRRAAPSTCEGRRRSPPRHCRAIQEKEPAAPSVACILVIAPHTAPPRHHACVLVLRE